MTIFFIEQTKEGHLPKSAKAKQLAEFCVAVMQGAMLIGKVRGESKALESAFQEVITHFEQSRLSPKNSYCS